MRSSKTCMILKINEAWNFLFYLNHRFTLISNEECFFEAFTCSTIAELRSSTPHPPGLEECLETCSQPPRAKAHPAPKPGLPPRFHLEKSRNPSHLANLILLPWPPQLVQNPTIRNGHRLCTHKCPPRQLSLPSVWVCVCVLPEPSFAPLNLPSSDLHGPRIQARFWEEEEQVDNRWQTD